jgi:hypothetical protein
MDTSHHNTHAHIQHIKLAQHGPRQQQHNLCGGAAFFSAANASSSLWSACSSRFCYIKKNVRKRCVFGAGSKMASLRPSKEEEEEEEEEKGKRVKNTLKNLGFEVPAKFTHRLHSWICGHLASAMCCRAPTDKIPIKLLLGSR